MRTYKDSLIFIRMTDWLAETKLGQFIPTDDEINEMIEYYTNTEEYDFCIYLRDYKQNKNNSLSNVAQ